MYVSLQLYDLLPKAVKPCEGDFMVGATGRTKQLDRI